MIIVLVVTREKYLGTDFNQENWMLVIWLMCKVFKIVTQVKPVFKDFFVDATTTDFESSQYNDNKKCRR